ncbi:hypothetical protein [Amphritea japonica]|uniref:hypothetical protein n=1 Tax=Amphritea japonica TaxID=452627 RepID=UPI00036EC662|nr:hypothetical protein [Amphritea japonica]
MTTSTLCTNKLLMTALCSALTVWILTPVFIQFGETLIQTSGQFIQDANQNVQNRVLPSLCMTSAD